jgi:Zn-dependent protease
VHEHLALGLSPTLADLSVFSVRDVLFLGIGLLIALSAHEYAHAWMATRLGDITPKVSGRLSLDPRRHVDTVGTIILPALLLLEVLFGLGRFVFAFAKPQPMNPWALRRQDRHVVLIALAGPAANLLLAFVFGLVFRAVFRAVGLDSILTQFVGDLLIVNVILCVLNLLPIPPLDMTRVVARFLQPRAQEFVNNMEQYGALFMIALLFIVFGPVAKLMSTVGNGICQLTAGARCF